METYIPPEVWRHIRSFDLLPTATRTSSTFKDIEESLLKDRIELMSKKYRSINITTPDEMKFILHYAYLLDLEDPRFIAYYLGQTLWRDSIRKFLTRYNTIDVRSNVARGAASEGHFSIILLAQSFGPIDYYSIAMEAVMRDNTDIVDWAIHKDNTIDVDDIALSAANFGSVNTLVDMIDRGVTSTTQILIYVCEWDNIEDIKRIINIIDGITDDDLLQVIATTSVRNDEDIVYYLSSHLLGKVSQDNLIETAEKILSILLHNRMECLAMDIIVDIIPSGKDKEDLLDMIECPEEDYDY